MIIPATGGQEGLNVGFIVWDDIYDSNEELQAYLLRATAFIDGYSTRVIYWYVDSRDRRVLVDKSAQNTVLHWLRRYELPDHTLYSNDAHFPKRTDAIKRDYERMFGRFGESEPTMENTMDTLTGETLSLGL